MAYIGIILHLIPKTLDLNIYLLPYIVLQGEKNESSIQGSGGTDSAKAGTAYS